MALRSFQHAAIRGIAAALPEQVRLNSDINADEASVRKTAKTVGITKRHIAQDSLCTSDLCYAAAEQLIQDLGWEKDSIDAVIFLSQTPDYLLPATACVLQERLGLSTDCAAFDMTLGCSGYVYGLLVAYGLIAPQGMKRILLLVGDTISKVLSPEDMPANVLFGDAGTATAIEYSEQTTPAHFLTGTDGSGAASLIIEAGGFRKPSNADTKIRKAHHKDHVIRSEEELFMDGSSVFSFTLSRVPESVNNLLTYAGQNVADIDTWLFHQANKFMLDYLGTKIGIAPNDMPSNINEYGNTSPPSIPLLAVTNGQEISLSHNAQQVGMVAFGVGLSWAAATLELKDIVLSDLVLVSGGA